ncbi:MAG: alanyl-tRNA editing protein [Nanoarchaeota archaeon]|nr:alanyl-tRNA editing protein [Nanoarchaeota archaeon]
MESSLYLSDCYLKEINGKIESASQGKYIILDRTIFYPNKGGQPFDTGKIIDSSGREYNVIYVAEFSGKISHEVDEEGLTVGDSVQLKIDWNRRYRLMRMHTAAHVFSRIIYDEAGAVTSGNQLGLDRSRIDFTLENFDRAKVEEWETKANDLIAEGREVKIHFYDREEAFRIPDFIRTEKILVPEGIEKIRIIEIDGVDMQACGGTHLGNISEIKGIKIVKCENKGKNNKRIYFELAD